MGRQLLQIGRSSDESKSPTVSVERLLNGYIESAPQGREPQPVFGTPGLTAFGTLGSGPVRGMLETVETLWAVSGTALYSVASDGTGTSKGSLAGTAVVDMASDGTNIVTVAGGTIYVWNGTTFAAVTDLDAPAASSVSWMNGFFVFTEDASEQFFIAPMNNPGGDYDALDFDSSDQRPDKLVRSMVLGTTLLLWGRQSCEFWFYSGDATFPFERYQDEPLDVGLRCRDGAVTSNGAVYFLANDLTIRRLDGRTATRISTYAVAKIIESWADPALTVASCHVINDHLMVVFRNPDGCVVYDQASGLWHERGSFELDSWRCRTFARCFDKNLFGSATNGKIYELDTDAYDEDGHILPFEMITPFATAGGLRGSINELEVIMETGVGATGVNPQLMLERTRDGRTWTGLKLRGFGAAGYFVKRVLFGTQGQSRGMAFRLRITDAVKRVVLAIYADVEIEQ